MWEDVMKNQSVKKKKRQPKSKSCDLFVVYMAIKKYRILKKKKEKKTPSYLIAYTMLSP